MKKRFPVHGILFLDKPRGLSSNAALGRAKRVLNAQKAGHTGTLDPLASGLLPLCFGEATKFSSDLLHSDKRYAATLALGVTTTTADAEGEVLEKREVHADAHAVELAVSAFRGPISQVPPMYSALKRDGKPLYEYARAGITLERAAREVLIHRLEITGFHGTSLDIDVTCSKGTYIRTLAEDIGARLGCGAHLTALRRLAVGPFDLTDSVSLEHFESLSASDALAQLRPVDALLGSLRKLHLGPEEARRFNQGQRIAIGPAQASGRVAVYQSHEDRSVLLGLADIDGNGVLAPFRLVAEAGSAAQQPSSNVNSVPVPTEHC